jgi:hypothetical protein
VARRAPRTGGDVPDAWAEVKLQAVVMAAASRANTHNARKLVEREMRLDAAICGLGEMRLPTFPDSLTSVGTLR